MSKFLPNIIPPPTPVDTVIKTKFSTALIRRSAQAIANLIADIRIGLDVQKVVLGGSVGLAQGYLPLVREYLAEMPPFYHCDVESARSGQDAGLIGAAWWVADCLKKGITL